MEISHQGIKGSSCSPLVSSSATKDGSTETFLFPFSLSGEPVGDSKTKWLPRSSRSPTNPFISLADTNGSYMRKNKVLDTSRPASHLVEITWVTGTPQTNKNTTGKRSIPSTSSSSFSSDGVGQSFERSSLPDSAPPRIKGIALTRVKLWSDRSLGRRSSTLSARVTARESSV